MSATRVTDSSTCASTINVTVNYATSCVVVVVEVDRARDQREAAEGDPACDHDGDRSRDYELNVATQRRWEQRYGADMIPVGDRAWARWRALRREAQRDLEARHRERVRTRRGGSHPRGTARRRARAARRVVRTTKTSSDDGDGGDGDGGRHESGAL